MTIAADPRIDEMLMRLPKDGGKHEWVDGKVLMTPAGYRHDAVGARLIGLLYPHTGSVGSLAGSRAGFRMKSGNIRCPDVSFTRWERMPGGIPPIGFLDGAPDLAVEIVSPSDRVSDLPYRVNEYLESRSSQVWIVDPEAESVAVYRSAVSVETFDGDAVLTAGDLLPGFRVTTSTLFDIGPKTRREPSP